MKNLTLLMLLTLPCLAGTAQNIPVSFTGTVPAVSIDSITATNLATNESVTLPGDATLLLSPKTGISTSPSDPDFSLVFPNPFPGQATILTRVTEAQAINLSVRDLSGRTVAHTRAFVQPGESSFSLSLSTTGIYLAILETSEGTKAHKLICTAKSEAGNQVIYSGIRPSAPLLKTQFSAYSLGYSTGETIQYRCCCGDFRKVFTDSPMEPVRYEVAFPPIAAFTIDMADGTIYDRIVLDASACKDAETPTDELEVRWDLNGDSIWDTEFDQSKFMLSQFPLIGSYKIILEVRDPGGLMDSVSFSVNITYPFFTDSRDGNVYHYKWIGDQSWMVQNLAYLPEVNPVGSGSATAKHYYVYGYQNSDPGKAKETESYITYGALYNWEAAKTACPPGWHLPTDEEWQILEKHLGMSDSDVIKFQERVSGEVGKKLKSTSGWDNNGNGDNSTGFNALPAGTRWRDFGFVNRGSLATFWSASGRTDTTTYCRYLGTTDGIQRWSDVCWEGFSVRCIKN